MITLFGLNKKAFKVLEELVRLQFTDRIDAVIIGQDKHLANDYSSDIESICKTNGITYYYRLQNYTVTSSHAIAIGWRWIIRLDHTKLIVLHDSALPRYRGFAPVVNALINGETTLGVTALFASDEYDNGDIIYQETIHIQYPIRIEEAFELLAPLYVKLAIQVLEHILNLPALTQIESEATYSIWRDEADFEINWEQSAIEIQRFVHAVGAPYAGANTSIQNRKLQVLDVEVLQPTLNLEIKHVGKVLKYQNGLPVIICGEGQLILKEAIWSDTSESIFPLHQFRIRFQ